MADQNATILVVDDVAENRDLLIRRLRRLGFTRLDQAADGREALAAIAQTRYDLVLLDIMMPELDGFGVLAAMNADGRIHDLPVIVVSALNEIEPVVRCIELGADDFLFKPFNPTLLRARVLATLEKKALRDRTRDELRRKQVELNEARTLQLALVPAPFDGTIAGQPVGIRALLEPAKEVGGDLVDHFIVGSDLIVLVVGDVSDKGAAAALMMARTHAMFRAMAGRPDAPELFADPARAVSLANDALARGNVGCMFVTFLLAVLHAPSGVLSYVRAGHIPPFLRAADGGLTRLSGHGGPALGVMEEFAYRTATHPLVPGDRLLVVTDGFTEAQDAGEALYGEERLGYLFAALDGSEADTLGRLVSDVRAFEAGLPAFDDMAAILLTLAPLKDNAATSAGEGEAR
ncbi:PP2C family protein-serine/threonine phosphatase [Ancylobacter amanitiformis]|uniref:Sigma-B regulation protein RsbU (Phosphoserine phosphatase) n=1 Tax=Ancylobacter amanitiformis TaxID=217069 RepID=A0ABU0LKM9_9HYPH|nr:fused response regulator/phosphatase [Ancylobacter amanitiformis]MDQ0509238.1 sigma-B regulation protein RsbU (phosphoserine phosphatase) [Ancylobacter amanitiformis]